jgi:hypothetical protein
MVTFRLNAVAALAALLCLWAQPLLSQHENSLAMAEDGPHLTAEQAIAAARRNAKPGSSFTILWKIIANADTRRIGDQALEQAQAHKIELYENGILVDILRSGGYLLAETNPRTNSVVSFHLVTLVRDGTPEDLAVPSKGINLVETQELVKDTTELVEQLYSTPSTEESSLESRFYGGSFPEGDLSQDTLFAIPNSLRKLGANPKEVREAAALFGGYIFWEFRYALSMPAYAASPVAAENAAEDKRDKLKAEFLRSDHMDPKLDLDLGNIQNERQLQERIQLLTRLDKFLEDALKNEGDQTIVRANLSIATMPLGVDVDLSRDEGHYGSSTPSMFMFFWHRLVTDGFAVKMITAAS